MRTIVLGLAAPLLVGGRAYGIAYLAGLATFVPQALPLGASWAGPLGSLALWIALNATLGTLLLLLPVAGEEIGWRGYLLPRLIAAGMPQPMLVSGLIWGSGILCRW